MKTIAIIGGSQKQTFETIGKKFDCNVLFHDGKVKKGAMKKDFRTIIKKADHVIILLGAVGHVPMDCVKDLCKRMNKKIDYHKGFGATGAFQKVLDSQIA